MDSISSRGNDSQGKYMDDDVFLGHHRLAIIDTSNKSNQPMQVGKHVIVFNGVIFNYRELRSALLKKGHSFSSSGDTEVIIRSYIEYGSDCVNYLDGVFAFCIYDKENKKLFLARDRIGIKPLYFLHESGQLYFSSHMKGILKNMVKRKVNPIALNYQFTLHSVVPAPHTIIDNIQDDFTVMTEEPFGPITAITTFKNFDEVIKRANKHDCGLAGYVCTNSMEKAFKASEQLETGVVAVNTPVVATAETPFGGIKQTGYGREGGSVGIKDYLNIKYTHLGLSG